MIHLLSPSGAAFCKKSKPNELITPEEPHGTKPSYVCELCWTLYFKAQEEDHIKRQEAWNNRPTRQKIHDWLHNLAHFGESHLEIILYILVVFATLGLVIPAKHVAKVLLKAGI